MLYLTCTTITSIDLAHYGVSRAKDRVSVKCGTRILCKNQRDLTPKLSKGYQLFLHIIHSLNLPVIHISTKFHQDILNTCIYIVMKHTK